MLANGALLRDWNNTKHGRCFRFCDQASLDKVRQVWMCWVGDEEESKKQENRFDENMNDILRTKKAELGEGMVLTAYRSAAPLGFQVLGEASELHKHFWKHGTTDQSAEMISKARRINPMFFAMLNTTSKIHYGTDPILGFHLATAFAPCSTQPCQPSESSTSVKNSKVLAAAKAEFSAWCSAFRLASRDACMIRSFVGDAISFSLTLGGLSSDTNTFPLKQYNGNWFFQPLELDGEYLSQSFTPTSFDIIDTSNLMDHVGLLNLLICTAPLLKAGLSSTLYTEMLVYQGHDLSETFKGLLCGPLSTVPTLLGLYPPEYWTNASATAAMDEGVLATVERAILRSTRDQGQLRSRVSWKLSSHLVDKNVEEISLRSEASDLAQVLHEIYVNMFPNENIRHLFQNLDIQKIKSSSTIHYHRATFAALLRCVKSNIEADWTKLMRHLLDLIEAGSNLLLGRNYIQELYLHLHLFGLYSVETLMPAFTKFWHAPRLSATDRWKVKPSAVCVTMVVPRAQIDMILRIPVKKLGTPCLSCTIQSSERAPQGTWHNIFAALQVGFGRIVPQGLPHNDSFNISVVADFDGWNGTSSLIVSFLVPTWILMLEPTEARISMDIQSTPLSTSTFSSLLGPNLMIFQTTLGDTERIFISKCRPHQVDTESFSPRQDSIACSHSATMDDLKRQTTLDFGGQAKAIVGLRCRVEFVSTKAKTSLMNGAAVELIQRTPMILELNIGKGVLKCDLRSPIPVSASRSVVRVARKLAYIELVCPAVDQLQRHAMSLHMFPTSMQTIPGKGKIPISWNMPRIDLDRAPDLDLTRTTEMQWLTTHTSLMFSTRESQIREANISKTNDSALTKDVRVDFKDGLFSMFMHFSGLQGQKARTFALYKSGRGGAHILVFVSALRLDLARHTAVLDAAVLPLTDAMVREKKTSRALSALHAREKVCTINVTDIELQLWKQSLPSFAERCRTWTHSPSSCEYLLGADIPARSSLEDGHTPLCSCGCGHLPSSYLRHSNGPDFDDVLRRYATRVAISPCFAVPYVENCFDRNLKPAQGAQEMSRDNVDSSACDACGMRRADEKPLLCGGCRSARYCSKACQRTAWKTHKISCKREH